MGVVIVLSVVFVLVVPIARVHPGRISAFIQVIQTVLCFADVATAVLLFAQYSIQPQRAILALASGYFSCGLFAFLQTLKSSGMGLGLSISQSIIEDHGGELRLTKTSSNGCTFEFTLPRTAASNN